MMLFWLPPTKTLTHGSNFFWFTATYYLAASIYRAFVELNIFYILGKRHTPPNLFSHEQFFTLIADMISVKAGKKFTFLSLFNELRDDVFKIKEKVNENTHCEMPTQMDFPD